jgi:hypothetical protein
MVLITPRLVRALDPDEVPPLPTRFKPFMKDDKSNDKNKKPGGGAGGNGDVASSVVNQLQGTGMADAPAPAAATAKGPKKPGGAR